MDDRRRFVKTMTFGNPDRIPLWECAFWGETLERWTAEGMPENILDSHNSGDCAALEKSLRSYFGFDRNSGAISRSTVKVNIEMCPEFEKKVLLEESGGFVGVDKLERFSLLKADPLIKECGIDVREPENISRFLFNFSFKTT